ncbi:NAD(P)-dependent oxidoreductase [Sphingomonas sp. GC_Shp_1]|uniref:precorrin-2 dehydrogenase/sirohydrochlorin ferrochelatase family protein n=1 Tax=unclassified Sphingomonas TaxID=196159 RepID=UPI002269FB9C
MSLNSLPLFVRLAGRPVILIGDGEPADAKRRLLERAGAVIVGEEAAAALAIVAVDDPAPIVERLRARGILVNAVDRAELCDFTLPAIVDRHPVLIAIGTGGVSAGLAAALRQRLETILPPALGLLAERLHAARPTLRTRYPQMGERRQAIAAALAPGGPLDLLAVDAAALPLALTFDGTALGARLVTLRLTSADPDDLTLRQARALANADRVCHRVDVPGAILDRARADAPRIASATPPVALEDGLTVDVEMT